MHTSQINNYPAKIYYILTLAFLPLVLLGCVKTSSTPIAQETSQPFRFGNPVETETNALIAAESELRASFDYAQPLTVVMAKKTNYNEAIQLVGSASDADPKLKIWLVIYYNNKWQSLSHNPRITPIPPFRGCVFAIIKASDGSPVEAGGLSNPGMIAECNNQ